MVTVAHLTVSVGEKRIINDISLTFADKKTYAIMGPNGSGKSTFVQAIIGNPIYTLSVDSRIKLDETSLHSLSADKRAKKGIGVTFQSPLALQGISVFQLLRLALPEVDVLKLYEQIETYAKELKIKKELLERSLNEGASGGERKKLEVLQMAVLNPKVIFFDEIDTGVDIDSLKTIFAFLKKIKKDKTYIFITHYSKIFDYIKPDEVIVMRQGEVVAKGGRELAEKIEKVGYDSV